MSESKFETVSALVDNYQVDVEKLDSLQQGDELIEKWESYHLIGDAIRDELSNNIQLDVSDAIANVIEQEPTILAPKKSSSMTATLKAKVVELAKPFGQVAIAASAAGLMVLGVQQQNVAENDSIAPNQQVIQTIPFGGVADPVSFNYQTPSKASQKKAYIEQQRRFHALLADHQQQIKLSSVANPSNTSDKPEAQGTQEVKGENSSQ